MRENTVHDLTCFGTDLVLQLSQLISKTLKKVSSLKKSIKYPTLNRLSACVWESKTKQNKKKQGGYRCGFECNFCY